MRLDLRPEILKSLRAAPVILRTLVGDLSQAAAVERPGLGEWAVIEVIAHMADTDERARFRLQRMLTEENPEIAAFDQDQLAIERGYIEFSVEEELTRYAVGRAEDVVRLQGLRPAEWRRTSPFRTRRGFD